MKTYLIILFSSFTLLWACNKNSSKSHDTTRSTAYESVAEFVDEKEIPSSPPPQPLAKTAMPERDHNQPIHNTEDYSPIVENSFKRVSDEPVSTFSIDVDRASYSNMRRFLDRGMMPPKDAVRIEELVNYFDYQYPDPTNNHPYDIRAIVTESPWNPNLQLAHISMQAKRIDAEHLPPSNLVFLIDVSGSMMDSNKLPLLQSGFNILVDNLREEDQVSIVVYAGAAGLVLPPTSGANKSKIHEAIDNLTAGGSTAGGEGIQLAYQVALDNFKPKGNNRVILATDGDFNVGTSSDGELKELIEKQRDRQIYLSVLGFGMGNYKDNKLEILANNGNGNYAYIDGIQEARKVFVNEFGGTLFTVAKDVKLQIEFNPNQVQAYRLIGYENRMLNREDFNDDKKDAGELGAGHSVTAIYEIIPKGVSSDFLKSVDDLKYQQPSSSTSNSTDYFTIKTRYKLPDQTKSILFEKEINKADQLAWNKLNDHVKFSLAVAEFGLILRSSEYKGNANYENVLQLVKDSRGDDPEGLRNEFLQLVKTAKSIDRESVSQ